MSCRFELPDNFVSAVFYRALQLGWNINSSVKNLLVQACHFNYINVVRELLRLDNIDVNISVGDALPLTEAVTTGNLELIKLLVKSGAKVNLSPDQNKHGNAITIACLYGNIEVLNYLIDQGADLSSKNNDKSNLLHVALINDRVDIAFRLIELGVGIEPITNNNSKTEELDELIRVVFSAGSNKFFSKLRDFGLDIKINNEEDAISYFYYASMGGSIEILNYVIEKGGKVGYVNGQSPLHYACQSNRTEIVKRILEVGGDVNGLYGYNLETPLHVAYQFRSVEAANLLLDSGADPKIDDRYGRNSLFFAYAYKHIPILMNPKIRDRSFRWAVECYQGGTAKSENREDIYALKSDISVIKAALETDKINVNMAFEEEGNSALHIFCERGCLDVIILLIENGADIEMKNNQGATPLLAARKNENLEVFEYLLSKGANLKAKDLNGRNAFHYVCMYGNVTILDHISKLGTFDFKDVDSELNNGLHLACKYNKPEIFDRLIMLNVFNINGKNKSGEAPAHLALGSGKMNCYNRLVDLGAKIDEICQNKNFSLDAARNHSTENLKKKSNNKSDEICIIS